jgi:hypothetical protein
MSVWSLNHCTMVLFVTQVCSSNLAKISNLGDKHGWRWHDHGPSCPSTAYESSQSPCICQEWMWEPFSVGLEPRSMHHDIVFNRGVLQ